MTPAARVQAAIEILEAWLAGAALERALLSWSRQSRFAGSKDRAAIQDIVYDIVRQKLTLAAQAGCATEEAITARRLALGYLRHQGIEEGAVFGSGGYGPAALAIAETAPLLALDDCPAHWRLNLPPQMAQIWHRELGEDALLCAQAQESRAGMFLRVNLRRGSREKAQEALMQEGIKTQLHPTVKTALQVTENPRRVQQSKAFHAGLVEIQDAHSQAVLAVHHHERITALEGPVLDACAGGGGKALAAWDLWGREVHAHDAAPQRLGDIAPRAARAGAQIRAVKKQNMAAQYSTILCDVPCSGSGTWRRNPGAKWAMTPKSLEGLLKTQREILTEYALKISPGGVLIYMTCSVFSCENEQQIDSFLTLNPRWKCNFKKKYKTYEGGDGLFVAALAP